ncbi:MAG: LysR family transcriptional regulator [Oscillospiraceae bacterium]
MDIKKYEVLLGALDKGCFTKACEGLGYTQPAITGMMKSMEQEIGFPLLRRSNKGIQLTTEGEEVLPLIQEIVNLNEKLTQKYDLLRGLETGRVRIGSFPTVACAWLPAIISRFEKRYPHIQIELLEENSLTCLEKWLSSGYIDLCFISKQPHHTFKWFALREDPYYALLSTGHPLTAYESIPVEMLAAYPFLICKSKDGPDADISRYFAENHLSVQLKFSSNLDYTIAFMVRENIGISMLPDLLLRTLFDGGHRGLEIRPTEPPASRQLGIAVRSAKDISPAMSRFIKCAQSVAEDSFASVQEERLALLK